MNRNGIRCDSAEYNTAHPAHNKLNAARITTVLAHPEYMWQPVVQPRMGYAFRPVKVAVYATGDLWAYDTAGDGYIVASHWLSTNFQPCPQCDHCGSRYVPCDCGTDN